MRLRVLSLNAWGLIWPIGTDVSERTEAIASALPAFEVDVAAFQEVWTEAMRERLVEAGRATGLAHVWHNPSAQTGGGLLVLSRIPIARAEFHAFELGGLAENVHHGDYLGGKGFALLELATDGGPLAFLDTHLHASYAAREIDPYIGHRTGQVVQIASALRSIEAPLVAVGDFNFSDARDEYTVLAGLAGISDVARTLGRESDTVLADNPYRAGRRARGERIDYVFTRSGLASALAPVALERVLDGPLEIGGHAATYSDHAGLFVEIEVGGAGAPLRALDPDAIVLARGLLDQGRSSAGSARFAQRSAGALGLTASLLGILAARSPSVSRRRFLHASFVGGVALLGLGGTASLIRSEGLRREEIHAFDTALRRLVEMPS